MSETNMYHSLLKMLLTRENYYKYINFLKQETLPDAAKTIIQDFDYYYSEYEEINTIDVNDFFVWFGNYRHRSYSQDLLEAHKVLLDQIDKSKPEQAEVIIQHFNTEALRATIEKIFEENQGITEIVEACENYLKTSTLSTKLDSCFHDMESDEDDDKEYKERQLAWRLSCLNDSIGKIGPGDFGIVFAGTNAGKTSFLCSEVSEMCSQIKDGNVLWFYNEGSFMKLKYRFWSAALGLTNEKIRNDVNDTKEKYREYCGGDINKVRFYNATNMSIYDIEQIAKVYKPKLIVIDQLDNLSGFDKSARDDIRALKLFQRARSIAINNNCPMIVADQATGTQGQKDNGETWFKKWLNKEQLQGSRLAKQSTAEFMIGIGYNPAAPEERYITTPKVKSLEGSNNNEMQATTYFQREVSRFRD